LLFMVVVTLVTIVVGQRAQVVKT